jgi:hypothetical protein
MFNTEQLDWLNAPLSSENVKTRKQAGRTLSYLEGWVAISEANRIFGYDGWTRETVYCKEISRQEVTIGKGGQYEKPGWKIGYEAKVRITVGETVREGTGHGSASMTDLFDCIESAAKEAETDAMKRGFMTFGNQFGLALYDKEQRNVSRDGGLTGEADQKVADSITKYVEKFSGPQAIPVPNIDDEKERWKKWMATFKAAVDGCVAPEEVDTWVAKNGVALGNLGASSEKGYDYLQEHVEAKKAALLEKAGFPNTTAAG